MSEALSEGQRPTSDACVESDYPEMTRKLGESIPSYLRSYVPIRVHAKLLIFRAAIPVTLERYELNCVCFITGLGDGRRVCGPLLSLLCCRSDVS